MANGRENTLSQMRELITQCYNHPSIAVWGLSNEITAASAVNDDLLENHRLLNELCHRMDQTRLTTMADVFMLEIDSPILEIPDINSYNLSTVITCTSAGIWASWNRRMNSLMNTMPSIRTA